MVKVNPGETVLITIDSVNDWRVAEETAKAAAAVGAKVYGRLALNSGRVREDGGPRIA